MIEINGYELNVYDHVHYNNYNEYGMANIDGEIIILNMEDFSFVFATPFEHLSNGVSFWRPAFFNNTNVDHFIELQFKRWGCSIERAHHHIKHKIPEAEWQFFL